MRELGEDSTGFLYPPAAIQIKTLLKERYKQGFPIIKEIIQNANDGGAKRLDIGVSSGFDTASHPLLQCPALFFINDGSFRDEDAQAIRYFGIDLNAKDSAKIGKFGLGQKSIFHLCEAFFYIASSELLRGDPYRFQFINPWANPTDPKQPKWKQLTVKDKEIVENYLSNQALLGKQYFILWIPLRRKEADNNRCIVDNYYDERLIEKDFPKNMGEKITTLLPMLRSLREVHYWLPNDAGQLQEEFHVYLDAKAECCSYPKSEKPDRKDIPKMQRPLFGCISLRNRNAQTIITNYAGWEAILAANQFHQLLPSPPTTLDDIKKSTHWPKPYTKDQEGNIENQPDKAVPHCAVVFSRTPVQGEGSLNLQWAVFLPLVDEQSDVTEFQNCKCDGNWNYTLLLHGYFFPDSGRRYVEVLKDICEDRICWKLPENENDMIRQWNAILATVGTLYNLLPALNKFCRRHQLEREDIANLCASLRETKIFKSTTCQEYIYTDDFWVYQLQPEQYDWQLVKRTQKFLPLPSISEEIWSAFPELCRCAKEYCLVLSDTPNLFTSCKPDNWEESDIQAILKSLNLKNVFEQVECIDFLVNLLKLFSNSLTEKIQNCLKAVLLKGFINLELMSLTHLKDSLKKVINLIDESNWFELPCNDTQILRIIQNQVNILILPMDFAPQRKTEPKISGHDAGLIVSYLVRHSKTDIQQNETLILQIIKAIPKQEMVIFREYTKDLKFVSVFNCRSNISEVYTPSNLVNLQQQGLLFLNLSDSRKIAAALQAALKNKTIILVNNTIANNFLEEEIRGCNHSACLSLIKQKPELSNIEDRAKLLEELL
ncbi:hypothetical protein GNF07_29160 (plasmid) [Trichormus variabilis FSR]|uniref:sacsin N-terminal ATP-binding-like domain-containing protein n=1 Tax=Anabaena variabilis TaxID=264691 RepID=UPI00162AB149|nr:hypothetical protein [Trichormus variabilis]MBC1271101.1 hypothetical protein [Trichormus variabilis FSR]